MRWSIMDGLIADDWRPLALRLAAALAFGLVLGAEREWRGHDAGIRTHAITALSAATITLSALLLFDALHARGGDADPLRAVQGLAQAIGFIAGGLIFVRGGDVRNMTTAASLWMAAAGGIAAGAGQWRLLALAAAAATLLLTLNLVLQRIGWSRDGDRDAGATRMPNRRGSADQP
ncbi:MULTISPECIES: MgtC/SapB family protein [unclassified Sphingomonas]|jgi:putative Mg2+ transporter-C (MgtC) family protein|uniref:MgtC/SapB family protein n=1 Tax=unclassified Sphingomonas TaxID=196159 RepID=UPI001E55C0F9|nr:MULTISPECIES: MgtC/SapB family protein [unclassified Sphingomonas]